GLLQRLSAAEDRELRRPARRAARTDPATHARMSSLYQKRRKRPELNLVPLIDVLVMLVFFAFVTMQFKSAATLNITLPKVETAGKNEFRGNVTISVDKAGVITLNGKEISEIDLDNAL